MNADELLKSTDLSHIATAGAARYRQIRQRYEPGEHGKFVAIDIDSGEAYLAATSAGAVVQARARHPGNVFYVVKVGYDAAETMAHLFNSPK